MFSKPLFQFIFLHPLPNSIHLFYFVLQCFTINQSIMLYNSCSDPSDGTSSHWSNYSNSDNYDDCPKCGSSDTFNGAIKTKVEKNKKIKIHGLICRDCWHKFQT